jgi:hypothetical protein
MSILGWVERFLRRGGLGPYPSVIWKPMMGVARLPNPAVPPILREYIFKKLQSAFKKAIKYARSSAVNTAGPSELKPR